MRNSILLLLLVVNLSCIGQGEPATYDTDDLDSEMNAAVKKSKDTFNDFILAFDKQKGDAFAVKMAFPTKNGAEHIWLSNIQKKEGKLYGTIDNEPEGVATVKLGDAVEIVATRVSDWFYIADGKLVGGLTIRVIRNRMTPAERKQFDRDFGVKIE
jgi:uncharacterized protein YegJ (DUF2314 family)